MCPLETTLKVSPLEFLRRGGTAIGENGIEPEGTEPSGSDGAGGGAQSAIVRGGGDAGVDLSAEQADLGAVPGGRSEGVTAWELWSGVESGLPVEVSSCGTET